MLHPSPRRARTMLRATVVGAAAAAAVVALAPAALATTPSGDWAAGQLTLAGTTTKTEHYVTSYTVGGSVDSYDDTGSTIDGYLALKADDPAGYATHLARTINWVRANQTSYYSDGSGTADCAAHHASGELYAGPLAKTAFVMLANGNQPPAQLKLLACLQGSVTPGRFSDGSAFGDYSNTFGQAFAIMDFVKSPSGTVAAAGAAYLESQQCTTGADAGSFASSFDSGCSTPDVDATGMAAMALQAFADHAGGAAASAAGAAAKGATDWLAAKRSSPGAPKTYWTGTSCGPAAPSVNSTALAVLAVQQVRGAASAIVTRGRAWLASAPQTQSTGEMTGCPASDPAVRASNDVRATTQGVLGKDGVTYPDLIGI